MYKKIFILFVTIITLLIGLLYIYTITNLKEETNILNQNFNIISDEIKDVITDITPINIEDDSIGYLRIDKINLNKKLYDINNSKNNVERNITILDGSVSPDYDNSILFLAAHSGTGIKAFFRNLNKISIGDEINLTYNDKDYIYEVDNIWETEKDGDIEVRKTNDKQLILTTCSNNETKQLVINSTIKES